MARNMLASALFAGVIAGILATVLELAFVIPLVTEGELYETGARVHFATDGTPQSAAGSPGLGDEPLRHIKTLTFTVLTFLAYAMVMVALMAFAQLQGRGVTARQGILWGLGGFVALQLAPSLGLPPELPGAITAEVGARQLWWTATVVVTLAGLWLIAFGRGPIPALAGALLLVVPHAWGAPHLDTYWGVAPPELAARFATTSLGVAAAGWALLGFFTAFFWTRLETDI